MTRSNKFIDMTGARYGRISVIARHGRDNQNNITWQCRCDCGSSPIIRGKSLRTGDTTSCGCRSAEVCRARSLTHGHATKAAMTPTFRSWSAMMNRCNNPNNAAYQSYGGRGIIVCSRWSAFDNFLTDMGERPSLKHSIDRYPDNDGNYEPSNCRWATVSQQARNRRNNRMVMFDGRQVTLAEAAELSGTNYHTLRGRLQNGRT